MLQRSAVKDSTPQFREEKNEENYDKSLKSIKKFD